MDLAFLREGAVWVLGALRAPALGEHRLHDVGLRALVSLEGRTDQLRRTSREAGEVGAPLMAQLWSPVPPGDPKMCGCQPLLGSLVVGVSTYADPSWSIWITKLAVSPDSPKMASMSGRAALSRCRAGPKSELPSW